MATLEAVRPVVQTTAARGLWTDAFARLRKNRLAMVGLVLVIVLLLLAILGPIFAPYP
ncbi:MAG: ABC transporter permease, partial [Chloroflexota bacterium]